MAEMTFNQALQEVTRFKNLWHAAEKLEEVIHAAADLEASVKRLDLRKQQLESETAKMEESAATRQAQLTAELEVATVKHRDAIAAFDREVKQLGERHAEQVEKKRNETLQEMDRLTLALATKQAACTREAEAMDEQIKTKRTLIAELNQQLDALRERLG